jgi:hypothetical protein
MSEWLQSLGWSVLYAPIEAWLVVSIVVLAVNTIRRRHSSLQALVFLFAYIVLARIYSLWVLLTPISRIENFEEFGSEFTGGFLWVGVVVAAVFLSAAVLTIWQDRKRAGKFATTASVIIVTAIVVMMYNTLADPIKFIRLFREEMRSTVVR